MRFAAGITAFLSWSSLFGTAVATADEKTEFGQYLSGSCVTCHQLSGADNGIPSIVGWDQEAFVAVLMSYKTKERDNKAMQTIAAPLSKEEMEALAAYFGTIQPKEE
jgi:cytochrome c